MSEQYKINNPEGVYFITLTVIEWIDFFTRKEYKDAIVEDLKFCQSKKGLNIHAWVLMHSHLHMIASMKDGHSMSDWLRDFKKHTSKRLVSMAEDVTESRRRWLLYFFKRAGQDLKRIKNHKFWQDGNQPKELFSNDFIQQKVYYIHQNPVKEGLVYEAEHYVYSSAIDYAGGKGLLEVVLLY